MSFAELLTSEFRRRQTCNRRYSLRAFARSLKTDHSTVSQFLRRKRPITAAGVRRMAAALGLGPEQIDELCDETTLCRLTTQRSFRPDSRKIAGRLGISVDEVNVLLQRLLRHGVLTMESRKSWRANG
jgi:plasmid maintenance system antidote protein VapI